MFTARGGVWEDRGNLPALITLLAQLPRPCHFQSLKGAALNDTQTPQGGNWHEAEEEATMNQRDGSKQQTIQTAQSHTEETLRSLQGLPFVKNKEQHPQRK